MALRAILYEVQGSGFPPDGDKRAHRTWKSNVRKQVLAQNLIEAAQHVLDTHSDWKEFELHQVLARSGNGPVEWAGQVNDAG